MAASTEQPTTTPTTATATSTLPTTAAADETSKSMKTTSVLPPNALQASQDAVKLAQKEMEGTPEEGKKNGGDHVTVFHNSQHFNRVHPLSSAWTLWFDNASKQDKAKDWKESLQQVMKIQSVEEFWGLYNNILPPSHIAISSNYYLFRKGVVPAWEDAANERGGKWSVQIPRDKNREQIDVWWLYTMLAAIGEIFETPFGPRNDDEPAVISNAFTDEVTGVIISSRRAFYRISIWTRTSGERTRVEDIGRHLKYGILNMPPGPRKGAGKDKGQLDGDVMFESHKDSQVKGNRNVYMV